MEELLKAVLSCLDGGERLEDVTQAHQIEVQTLRSWVKKYREMGAAGLEDRRGRRLAEQLPRGKEEALRIENARAAENQCIAQMVKEIHQESPDKGYRRIRDDLDRYYHTSINDKRALRICRCLGIQSTIKHAPQGCTRAASSPRHLAENVLNRRFYAGRPNEKWLTDVTEFHYYVGPIMRKLYLSAILDLCDRRIVSFVIRDTNDAALVHSTLDQALEAAPGVRPPAPQRPGQRLYHSDLP